MNMQDIIRAWKDVEYRHSLSPAEQALLPAHPAGLVELGDESLADVVGGYSCVVSSCNNTQDMAVKV